MLLQPVLVAALLGTAYANIFDFFNHGQQQQQQQEKVDFERQALDADCNGYLCSDTLTCVAGPQECPCPFPSSQLRCVLPNKEFICISKPAGDFGDQYDDPKSNFKVDAKSDDVRDCGWVKRMWEST